VYVGSEALGFEVDVVGDRDEGELVRDTVGSTTGLYDFVGACRKRDGAGVTTVGADVGFLLVLGMGDFVGFTLGL
jgi:hypothetical protein